MWRDVARRGNRRVRSMRGIDGGDGAATSRVLLGNAGGNPDGKMRKRTGN